MTKTIPACVLLIPTILLQFASGAAINTTSSTNLSAIDTNFCTDDGTWTGTGTRKTDCMAAVQRLYDVEVKKHGDEDFEFLSVAAWAKGAVSSIPPMQTPRKYAVGECCIHPAKCRREADRQRLLHRCHRHAKLLQGRRAAWRGGRAPCFA